MPLNVTYQNRIGKMVVLLAQDVTFYSDGGFHIVGIPGEGTRIIYPDELWPESAVEVTV